MVAYVFTPWREPSELLAVRRQFYRAQTQQQQQQQQSQQQAQASRKRQRDEDEGEVGEDENKWWAEQTHQHRAVARVSTWVQRGNCPHMVESTALLMAAILSDEQQQHQQQQKQQQAMAGGSGGSGGSGGHGPIDGAGLAAAWPQGLASTSPSSSYAVRAAYSAAFSR